MNKKRLARLAFASSMAISAAAFAQSDGPPRDDNGGPPNREQMQQRFANMIKDQLGVTDAEWTALQPKVEAVRALKRDASGQMGPGGPGGPGGGPGGRGGPNGGGQDGPPPDRSNQDSNNAPPRQGRGDRQRDDHKPSAVEQASHDLRDAVENDAAPEEITTKMKALRDARAAAKTSLAKAQTELQALVTPKQEAVLVSIGLLD